MSEPRDEIAEPSYSDAELAAAEADEALTPSVDPAPDRVDDEADQPLEEDADEPTLARED